MTPPLRLLSLAVLLFSSAAQPVLVAAEITTPPPLAPATHPGAGQILYFVLTDRFANGNTGNDTGGIPGGPDQHGFDPTKISHFHGGDFRGLTEKLDYIQQLGATAVWVTPPFRNKAMQSGTAGYHGYWITDFLSIDPHLGTDAEFRDFVKQAHARGLKVFLDIIVNHTADVISYHGGDTRYVSEAARPFRDASGRPFDEHAFAYNGVDPSAAFPPLAPDKSFAYIPVVAPGELAIKNPAWLNDTRLYHNRGNSRFLGESSLHGDFVGLDDLFTEHPQVVKGFIEIYTHWMREYGVDGFRIDTAKHVNTEFWQAFAPALRAEARKLQRPHFQFFGEVSTEDGDPRFLSEYSTIAPLDATIDFGFFVAARRYVSRGAPAGGLAEFFKNDDWYTDHDSNVHATTTFLGNHDAGRFGLFLRNDNPTADDTQLLKLSRLGHALMLLARGQPVIYYGDEQGMTGTGNDMAAREVMFPAQAPLYRGLRLIGSGRTGADDKFDPAHPLYRTIHDLAKLRREHNALSQGAMAVRSSGNDSVFVFSRLHREENVEYLVALNSSRYEKLTTESQIDTRSARLLSLYDSNSGTSDAAVSEIQTDASGKVAFTLAPLQYVVWRAQAPLPTPAKPVRVVWTGPTQGSVFHFGTRSVDGQAFPTRVELSVDVENASAFAEVTFYLQRKSRPNHYELLGTDDAAPHRVFWRPSADLPGGEEFSFLAVVDDLRGHRAVVQAGGMRIGPTETEFGIKGSATPRLAKSPEPHVSVSAGKTVVLEAQGDGTGELVYQWFHDGREISGATTPRLEIPNAAAKHSGQYTVLVRNVAGSVVSLPSEVKVGR